MGDDLAHLDFDTQILFPSLRRLVIPQAGKLLGGVAKFAIAALGRPQVLTELNLQLPLKEEIMDKLRDSCLNLRVLTLRSSPPEYQGTLQRNDSLQIQRCLYDILQCGGWRKLRRLCMSSSFATLETVSIFRSYSSLHSVEVIELGKPGVVPSLEINGESDFFPALQVLDVASPIVDISAFFQTATAPFLHLQSLRIKHHLFISLDSLESLMQALPSACTNLKKFVISRKWNDSEVDEEMVLSRLQEDKALRLSVLEPLQELHRLISLELAYGTPLYCSDNEFVSFMAGFPCLAYFSVGYTPFDGSLAHTNLTFAVLKDLAKTCPRLKSLQLALRPPRASSRLRGEMKPFACLKSLQLIVNDSLSPDEAVDIAPFLATIVPACCRLEVINPLYNWEESIFDLIPLGYGPHLLDTFDEVTKQWCILEDSVKLVRSERMGKNEKVAKLEAKVRKLEAEVNRLVKELERTKCP